MLATSRTRQLFGVFSVVAVGLFSVMTLGEVRAWLSAGDLGAATTTGLYLLLVGALIAGVLWGFLEHGRAGRLYTRVGGVLAVVGVAIGLGLAVPGYGSGAWAQVGAGVAFLVAGVGLAALAVGVPRVVDRLQFVD